MCLLSAIIHVPLTATLTPPAALCLPATLRIAMQAGAALRAGRITDRLHRVNRGQMWIENNEKNTRGTRKDRYNEYLDF